MSATHTYPQIPVDLTPTVTSPGLRLSPDLTSSRDGSDSAIQSSCFGFVKTPMFGLDGAVIVVEDIVVSWRRCSSAAEVLRTTDAAEGSETALGQAPPLTSCRFYFSASAVSLVCTEYGVSCRQTPFPPVPKSCQLALAFVALRIHTSSISIRILPS